jgi:hypothetical protein
MFGKNNCDDESRASNRFLELHFTPLPKQKKNFETSLNMSKHPLPFNLVYNLSTIKAEKYNSIICTLSTPKPEYMYHICITQLNILFTPTRTCIASRIRRFVHQIYENNSIIYVHELMYFIRLDLICRSHLRHAPNTYI